MKVAMFIFLCFTYIHSLYSQNKHEKEQNIIIRCNFNPLRVEYDGITYKYVIINPSKIDSLLVDGSYKGTPSVIYHITKSGGLCSFDDPNTFETLSCCIFGTRHYDSQYMLDSLFKIYEFNNINGSALPNEFLEVKLKQKKQNSYSQKYDSPQEAGIFSINFWLADVDYCVCDLNGGSKFYGGKAAYLTDVSNIRRLGKEDKKKLKIFFDKIINVSSNRATK